jgi:DNA repair exonuclease SbcCD ATPase subunit
MASESRDSTDVTVSIPADLESWLDQQADELGTDREAVLVQLLASYRAADELDDDVAISQQEAIDAAVQTAVSDRLPEVADAVEQRIQAPEMEGFEDRLDELEAHFIDKLDDVRQRVIQVKKEADSKADAEHTHEELTERVDALESAVDHLDTLERRLDDVGELEAEIDGVESRLTELQGRLDERNDDSERLDDVQEKLQTVAWVVRDLREERAEASATVDAIKRAAAEHDLSRARCENCGEGVQVGLLTEPSCPHCDAALDGIEPSSRMFGLGSATLTVAAQIEAGADETGDEMDDIDTEAPGDRR